MLSSVQKGIIQGVRNINLNYSIICDAKSSEIRNCYLVGFENCFYWNDHKLIHGPIITAMICKVSTVGCLRWRTIIVGALLFFIMVYWGFQGDT
jgi:hypothetical protein